MVTILYIIHTIMLSNYRIILGSKSPSRRELLGGLDLPFEVRDIAAVEEDYPAELPGTMVPLFLSCKKAAAFRPNLAADELLITADTIVWIDGHVLGKPAGAEEAVAMLRQLSGRTHEVITGVCLATDSKQRAFSTTTRVRFAELTDDEINYYVAKYRPFDKAGSYGIQEWIGYVGVEAIDGSFYNVMGLPVQRLFQELKLF